LIDHVQIWHLDNDDEARSRHERIEARLDELGPEEVRSLQSNGKLPTHWDPIIRVWMKGKRLAKREEPGEPKDGVA
jgi:hypothetical protein